MDLGVGGGKARGFSLGALPFRFEAGAVIGSGESLGLAERLRVVVAVTLFYLTKKEPRTALEKSQGPREKAKPRPH
jgi:hypothetical protein